MDLGDDTWVQNLSEPFLLRSLNLRNIMLTGKVSPKKRSKKNRQGIVPIPIDA